MPLPTIRRLAVVSLSLIATLVAPAAASAKVGPVEATFSQAFVYGLTHRNIDPVGANDFACKPTAAHPRPVVLLHGTYANRFNSFASLSPALAAQGYCVFALDYGKGYLPGFYGMQAIRASARQVAGFVDRVLAATGAPQVDVVGYSQGGLVARAYLKFYGGAGPAGGGGFGVGGAGSATAAGADVGGAGVGGAGSPTVAGADVGGAGSPTPVTGKVHALIGLSADNHGTTLLGLTAIVDALRIRPFLRAALGNSAVDQIHDSPFLDELNAPAETLPGVAYTMVATKSDEISHPYNRAWLTAAPGTTLTNVLLQAGCETDRSDHFNITYSPRAQWLVLRALDPGYAAPEPCTALWPIQ